MKQPGVTNVKVIFIILLFLISNGLTGEVPLENLCPSELGGQMLGVQIEHCTSLPCTFVRGRTYRADLTYTPGRNSSKHRIKCGSVVWNTPQTIAEYDVCEELGYNEKCPLTAGKNYTYGTSVKIPAVPPGTYVIHCDIIDDAEVKQVCIQGSARLVLW